MTIRKTTVGDLQEVLAIYAFAREQMSKAGNPQWGTDRPSEETIRADIADGNSYVLEEGGEPVGVFTLVLGEEPTYAVIENGEWLDDEPYGTLHRIASNGKARGVMQAALAFCESISPNMRVDTHEANRAMQHILEKNGYVRCGRIYVEDGSPRIAYQKEKG